MQKLRIGMTFLIVLLWITACGARYNPETGLFTVYGVAKFKVPAGFTQVGTMSVNVLPKTYLVGAYPYQSFNTTVFHNQNAYILSQVMTVPGRRFFIRPLLGTKVSKWGGGWRMNQYQLNIANTSTEYRRYIEYLKNKGLPVAPMYEVTMYDRLIGRRAIARLLFLTPSNASGFGSIPPANELYTLERDDFR